MELGVEHPDGDAPDDQKAECQEEVGERKSFEGLFEQQEEHPGDDGQGHERDQRVHDLENVPRISFQNPVGVIPCEDGQGSRGLLKDAPEEDGQKGKKGHSDHFIPGDLGIERQAIDQQHQEQGQGKEYGRAVSVQSQDLEVQEIEATLGYLGGGLVQDPGEPQYGADHDHHVLQRGEMRSSVTVFGFVFPGILLIGNGFLPYLSEYSLGEPELKHAEEHEDPGQAEPPAPPDLLTQVAAEENPEKGARVDAHVEDGVGPVLLFRVVLVHDRDDGGHVGFEKSRSHDQQGKPEVN